MKKIVVLLPFLLAMTTASAEDKLTLLSQVAVEKNLGTVKLRSLPELFNLLDKDSSGQLSLDEFAKIAHQ